MRQLDVRLIPDFIYTLSIPPKSGIKMNFYTFMGMLFLVILFLLNLFSLLLGYKYSKKYKLKQDSPKEGSMQIIEGSMFALLGLLLAFTFASAINKFDHRRTLIIEEANAIGTLYLRFDLLPMENRDNARQALKTYLDLHIKAYQAIPNIQNAEHYLDESHKWQAVIWNEATNGCAKVKNNYACMLVIPALNQVFDIENMRIKNLQMHPPKYIFVLLIFVALVATFFIGSHIHGRKGTSILHIISYSLVISLIIFTIIDMEYPRLGFIRVDSFDQVLIDLRRSFTFLLPPQASPTIGSYISGIAVPLSSPSPCQIPRLPA